MHRRVNLLQPGRFGRAGWLAGCMVLLLCGPARAAVSQAEKNAWDTAARSAGDQLWLHAEGEYGRFLKKFPDSEHYADAVLGEAEARFHLARQAAFNQTEGRQWSFKDVISLLAAQQSRADDRADAFAYWTAEACYNLPDYKTAADTYAALVRQFTNSPYRAQALVSEAHARLQLRQTAQVIRLLGDPEGTFQQIVKTNASDPQVVPGLFLLTETTLKQGDYAAATKALAEVPPQKQDLEWKRQLLLCRVNSEGGNADDALQAATNLLAAADDNANNRAESYLMLGDIYRRLERWQEAIAAYQTNLAEPVTPELQRRSLLNIVDLNLRQNQLDQAAASLQDFLAKNADETNSDLDLLALGELRLKQHFQTPGDTNLLQQAATNFQQLVLGDTNSELWGRAQLNLGWCLSTQGKIADSALAFSNAAAHLPHDEDQAVALFKLAEAQFLQTNYSGAIGNYRRVVDEFGAMPSVTNNLFEPALYQIVRAGNAQNNLSAGTEAVDRLVKWFPGGPSAQQGLLMQGEMQDRAGLAADARATFSNFIAHWPESKLRPQVELAIARTYERQDDWSNAVNRLYAWVEANTNHPSLPQAEFQLAWANFKNGNDKLAFSEFTNFLASYPTNELAAQAQYWIGWYHFGAEDFDGAERSFKGVFDPNSPAEPDLQAQARMMAGKSAFARREYSVATNYFYVLATDSNCPPETRMRASYALGDTLNSLTTPTNLAPCRLAISIFADIATNSGDALSPLAWGGMGDCYKKLAAAGDTNAFTLATNAYQNVVDATNADLATRSTAEFGIGQVLEQMARLKVVSDPARASLLQQAVDHYLNIVLGSNLRSDETQRDPFWIQQAGLQAAQIDGEDLKQWDTALNLYETLRDDLPPLRALLKKKIENAQKMLNSHGHPPPPGE
jgi:outer membrane protein assembly factor BamD (BamD/ComL family)